MRRRQVYALKAKELQRAGLTTEASKIVKNYDYIEFFTFILSRTKNDIELRGLPSKKRIITRDLNKLKSFIANGMHENLYYSVFTRNGGGTKKHTREVIWLFTDMDFNKYPHAEDEAKEILDGFPLKPSLIINSGNGFHVYWLISPIIENAFERMNEIETVLKGIASRLKSDLGATDIARVLRVPGTLNNKSKPAKKVEIIHFDESLSYRFEDFQQFSQGQTEKAPVRELYQGVPEGYRNDSLARLVGSWVNDKLTSDECLNMALTWNLNNPTPLSEREIYSTVKSIFEKHHREKREDQKSETPVIVSLDSIIPEKVEWLWSNYIPLGKITLFDGDPGVGKSLIGTDLIARITSNSPMPDGSAGIQGGAVILTIEDGLADTIVPRLDVAGGNRREVVSLQGVQDFKGNVRFPTVRDVDAILKAIHQVHAKIVVIDPLMGYLGSQVNSWRDQDIRQVLSPLIEMAEKERVAVIVIRHLNKTQHSNAIYRGGGSIGIIGVARTAFLVAKDPEDEDRRIFASVKCNLAPIPPALAYTIENCDGIPRVVWQGKSNHTANELLEIPASQEERSALDEAKDFLKDILSEESVSAKEIMKQAKGLGIAEKTLHRAKKALDVTVEKMGYQGQWVWSLNSKDGQDTPKVAKYIKDHLCTFLTTFNDSKGIHQTENQEVIDLEHEEIKIIE